MKKSPLTHHKEAIIRTLGVGLIALAALAAVGLLLSRRRRPVPAGYAARRSSAFDDWYAAGL